MPVKDLLLLLHGSEENIREDRKSRLDELLLIYDRNMGNDQVVTKLAEGIGLKVLPDVDPDMYFLTTLETFLMSRDGRPDQDNISSCRQYDLSPKVIRILTGMMNTPLV